MPKKSLKERAQELSIILPFMEGRTKGIAKELLGKKIEITEFGFIEDYKKEGHDYICYLIKSDAENFYFGGKVLTSDFHELDDDGYGEDIRAEGLSVMLGEKKSKDDEKIVYTTVEYL